MEKMENYPILEKLKNLSPEARREYIKKYFEALRKTIKQCDNEQKLQKLSEDIVKTGRDEEIYVLLILSMLPDDLQDEIIDIFPIMEGFLLNVMVKRGMVLARAYGIDVQELKGYIALLKKLKRLKPF